jgi:peptide/nickel transport system permease protein
LQSRSLREALTEPCVMAALARGVPRQRVIWKHALRLALRPVLAIYGIIIGGVLSGSFVVEIVMSWQGLGDLMYQALQARDLYLVAGCAAAGSCGLALGILVSDLAMAAIDPRVEERA